MTAPEHNGPERKGPERKGPERKGPERQHDFEQLVGQYANDLYRFGVWLSHDREVANDLVQETMLRAWRSMDSLNDVRAVKSWLFTTLRRENARRFERKRLPLVDIDDYNPSDDIGRLPDEELESDDMRKAIAQLPDNYREPLVMQALLGHSIAEIAEHMGLTESATMTRVFRARQKLKVQMEYAGHSAGHDSAVGSTIESTIESAAGPQAAAA